MANDFRGYIQQTAPEFLGYVGNDITGDLSHGVNYGKLKAAGGVESNYAHQSLNYQGAINTIKSLAGLYLKSLTAGSGGGGYSGGGGGASSGGGAYAAPQIFAPKLDIASVNAKARAAAEGAVNPYYTKVLNEFLSQQATQRQQQQTQYETNVQNLEDVLKQNLETSATNRTRTTEDVATNQAKVNQTADEFQTDTGQQFDEARQAQAKALATAGLTGGLGAQQVQKTQTARNTQEKRQEQDFQAQRDAQALFKGRTFEDLAKSDVLSAETTTKGKKQAKFDLDTFIQGSQANEQNKRNELERSRLGDIASNQAQQAKIQFNNWLATIKDPRQYLAAVQTYGGSF